MKKKELLWIYIPDYMKNGAMNSIKSIPNKKINGEEDPVPYWEEAEDCAGFEVSDDCPWRFEEMIIVSFTPKQCFEDPTLGCDQLVSYLRFQNKLEKMEEAKMQFYTTVFTCIVLSIASLTVSRDIEIIVI